MQSFRPDSEATLLRCFLYLLVLNAPFLGLYRAAWTGSLEPDLYPFLAVGAFKMLIPGKRPLTCPGEDPGAHLPSKFAFYRDYSLRISRYRDKPMHLAP